MIFPCPWPTSLHSHSNKLSQCLHCAIEIINTTDNAIEKVNYEQGKEKQIPKEKVEIYFRGNRGELNGIPLENEGFITLRVII